MYTQHTQKKHSKYTSSARKRRKTVSLAKSKRIRRLCTKCVLCTSAFTLTLLVPSEWNLSGVQTGLRQHTIKFQKEPLLPADTQITGQAAPSEHSAQSKGDKQTPVQTVSKDAALDKQTPDAEKNRQPEAASPDSDRKADTTQPVEDVLPSYKEYDMQKPKQITNTDEQTIFTDGSTTDEQIYYSYADSQPPFSENADNRVQAVPERLPAEQLLDTTVDDTQAEHFTQLSSDWNLILVNPWNPLPEEYQINLTSLPNGHSIDSRCYSALTDMLNDCRAAGCQPLICSSYRSQEKQESLYQERIDELMAQGYSKKDAKAKAATSVARPGTSEHQAGLAVDIVDNSHQILDATQQDTPVQQWLMENSWKYGFILRYPNDKSSLTGIIYEPWHYRYVGTQAAQEIYERGICLEEYLEELS